MSADRSSENTYLLNPESIAEMARLINQDRLVTRTMGGPLAELSDPSRFLQVLDLACGPGGWVLDVAFAYQDMDVAGVDISTTMIAYANARARSQALLNASFGVMNILEPLDFADESFDLVNARFLVIAIKRDDWPRLLRECMRILRPGGVLRLTEGDAPGVTNSSAFEWFIRLGTPLLKMAGYGFSAETGEMGMMAMLEPLLRDAGCQNIQTRAYSLDFSAGTEAHADRYHDIDVLFQTLQPGLVQAGIITQEVADHYYRQLHIEMLSDNFQGTLPFLTAWGTKPQKEMEPDDLTAQREI